MTATMTAHKLTQHLMRRFGLAAKCRPPWPLPLPITRRELPTIARALGYTLGAEIGVWKGEYAAAFCEAGVTMVCVDPWEPYQAWKDTKNALSGEDAVAFMESARQAALARLTPFGDKARICRMYSTDAAKAVQDRSLDFVYIDGNHGYDAVMDDLAAWSPKVRTGGFVAGHDYRVNAAKPFIEVVAAVKDFTTTHGIEPWFMLARDKTPSFLWEVR